MSVFISHSFKDKNLVQRVKDQLEKNGIDVWQLWNLQEGNPLAEELQLAILSCELCLFIATPNSIESPWCNAEVGAFWGAKKPIVVYLENSLEQNRLPPQVHGNLHVTDIADIVRAVTRKLETSKDTIPPKYFSESGMYGGDKEWNELLAQTKHRFDLMGNSLDGWRRTPGISKSLIQKASDGCRVRILLMHQDNPALEQSIKPEDGSVDFGSHREAIKRSLHFYGRLAEQNSYIEVRQILHGSPHGSLTIGDQFGIIIQYFYHINWAAGPLWEFSKGSKLYEQCLEEFDYLWELNRA